MQLEKILLVYGALLKEPTPKEKTLPLGGKRQTNTLRSK